MLDARRSVSAIHVAAASIVAQRAFIATPEFRAAKHLMLYAATDGEVHTDNIFAEAIRSKKAVYFPRIDQESKSIRAVRISSLSYLHPGPFGIPSPAPGALGCTPTGASLVVGKDVPRGVVPGFPAATTPSPVNSPGLEVAAIAGRP